MDFDVRDQDRYDALQAKLVPLWSSLDHLNADEQTIVVVPSADIDVDLPPDVLQAYEERYLFLLLLLRQPRARLIYLTGQAIHPDIVDYYLDLMPGTMASHARRRLHLLSPMEATFRPLSRKILERPRLLDQIRSLIRDPDRAHLIPFMNTWDDRELAMRLGIPMYGADPKDAHYGTKAEGRRIFEAAGVSYPAGHEDISTRGDVVDTVLEMRRANPALRAVVAKTNEGVSGFGNVTVALDTLPPAGADGERDALDAALDRLDVEIPDGDIGDYWALLEAEGGIVEELVTGDEFRSPSVQLRITPLGNVELLSTHDQILGGDSGQVFIGSSFPADPAYAALISKDARTIGDCLAKRGVIGRFAVDFVVARTADEPWKSYAIEINLRKGGTTHPFLTLQFLTDGHYDEHAAEFSAPDGTVKHYVASDHVAIENLKGLTPRALLHAAMLHNLHFDARDQVGNVFHMLSAISTHGQVGVTSVGNSSADAAARHETCIETLRRVAARAYQQRSDHPC